MCKWQTVYDGFDDSFDDSLRQGVVRCSWDDFQAYVDEREPKMLRAFTSLEVNSAGHYDLKHIKSKRSNSHDVLKDARSSVYHASKLDTSVRGVGKILLLPKFSEGAPLLTERLCLHWHIQIFIAGIMLTCYSLQVP